jgi:hypothetical protein
MSKSIGDENDKIKLDFMSKVITPSSVWESAVILHSVFAVVSKYIQTVADGINIYYVHTFLHVCQNK